MLMLALFTKLRKWPILCLVFSFWVTEIISQTTIPVNTSLRGTLTKSASPYYVKGNVYVPKDSTLIIEPGVQIRFDGKFQLSVYGNIKALGVQGDTIRFYPIDTNNRWKGIRYYGRSRVKDSAIFKYCKFEGAGPKLTYFESCLYLTQGNFRVSNCYFTNNYGVIYSNSLLADSILSLEVKDCYFYRNKSINKNPSVLYGVGGTMGISGGKVINCSFVENVARNPLYDQDEYQVDGRGSGGTLIVFDVNQPNSNAEINSCRFIRNNCGLTGAGIGIGYLKSSKVLIKKCNFVENTSGRFGTVSFIGNQNYSKANLKITIDSCNFVGNTAANTTTGPGEASALCVSAFASYDSLIVKNCVFSKNVSYFSCYIFGRQDEKNLYFINNTFKNNYSGCIRNIVNSQFYSIGNKYYNNLRGNYTAVKSTDNQFYSINDLYAYNGFKTDTIKLAKLWKKKYFSLVFKTFESGSVNDASVGSVYRNCIFWGNRIYGGKLNHLVSYKTKFEEVSNCIFQGHVDSTVSVFCDTCHYPYRYNIKTRSNLYYDNPIFVKPPPDFGPDANTDSVDFRLTSSCSQLSPAYNAGLTTALPNWSKYTDNDGNVRINCDTIDIGPYEIQQQVRRVHILKNPIDSAYCDNKMVVALSTTCNPNTSFTWQKLQGSSWSNVPNASTSTYQPASPSAGTYRAIYTQNDCNIADTSRSFNVTLRPSPKPNLGRDTTIEQKATLTLNAGNYSSYKWQDNSALKTFTVIGNDQGIGKKTYWVKVGASNGCSGIDSITIAVTWNSAVQSLYNQGWNIYPNPSKDIIHITNKDNQSFKWMVYNASGQEVLRGNETESINLASLPPGVYMLRIQSKDLDQTVRVSKVEN